MPEKREWFEEWFDSIWYDILYANRNEEEAEAFMDKLIAFLKPSENDSFLDLACGSGRHAICLAKKGYKVTGIDLSKRKIAQAKLKGEGLVDFFVHDMRDPLPDMSFSFILNLYTSFGYFESLSDHIKALNAIRASLKPGGKLVIDYMNARYVTGKLPSEYTRKIGGITFQIKKHKEKNCVIKEIDILEKGLHFIEKVRLFTLDDFREILESTDFEIQAIFGDYKLNPYEDLASERLIIITS